MAAFNQDPKARAAWRNSIAAQQQSATLPNGTPRDPNDPNQYWIDPKTGTMAGTLIGYTPSGSSTLPIGYSIPQYTNNSAFNNLIAIKKYNDSTSNAQQSTPAWYDYVSNNLPLKKLDKNSGYGEIQTEFGTGYRNPNNAEFFDNLMNAPTSGEKTQQKQTSKSGSSTLPKVISAGLLANKAGLFNSAASSAIPDYASVAGDLSVPSFGLEANPLTTADFTLTNPEAAADAFAQGAPTTAAAPSTLVQGLGALAALHGGYKTYKNFGKGNWKGGAMSGAEMGAGIGSIVPGVGTLVGAGVGAVAGGLLGKIKTGKQKDQVARDSVRKSLKENGFIDDNYNITLADGSKFDIGADGKVKNYNIDFSKEGIGDVVGKLNPLAEIITGGNDKLRSDFAGYLTNAATSNGDLNANIAAMYKKAGVDKQSALNTLNEMAKSGAITSEELAAYSNGLNSVFGGGAAPRQTKQTEKQPQKKKKKEKGSNVALRPVFAPTPAPTSNVTPEDIAKAYMNVYLANKTPTGNNPLLANRLLAQGAQYGY